jgi:hypothetical protein
MNDHGKNTANILITQKHNRYNSTITQKHNSINDLHDKSGVLTPPSPLDLDSRGGNASQETPALQNGDIAYIALTLHTPKEDSPERRDINCDFQLRDRTHYNKLVFDLVRSSRKREFFANIKEQYQGWHGYQMAYTELQTGEFIGKGRMRLNKREGLQKRSPIQLDTAMVYNEQEQTAKVWIEDAYFVLDLETYTDKNKLYCAKAWYRNINEQRYTRGGWR